MNPQLGYLLDIITFLTVLGAVWGPARLRCERRRLRSPIRTRGVWGGAVHFEIRVDTRQFNAEMAKVAKTLQRADRQFAAARAALEESLTRSSGGRR